jgi:hypothetical protein
VIERLPRCREQSSVRDRLLGRTDMLGSRRVDDALQHLKSLFLEVPGLSFSAEQACRMIRIDEETGLMLLLALVDTRFLERAPNGAFLLRVDECLPEL